MSPRFKKKFILSVLVSALTLTLTLPFPAHAVFDFGGWVLNMPGTHASEMFLATLPSFPPSGVYTFWDSANGICLNGVQEVDLLQAAGVPQPPILLQFVGDYTFAKGPATHSGQQILGKYFPGMVCMMNFVSWVYCGYTLCPVITPLPLFFAPLIIYNGSSI